jgi:hypothetical protein
MASTYTPAEALTWVGSYLKKMPISAVSPIILDQAYSRMWMAAEWRWTLGNLPSVAMKGGAQDYSFSLPSDFLYIAEAKLVTTNGADRHLVVVPAIEEDVTQVGQPGQIAAVNLGVPTGQGTYRLLPIPSQQPATPEKLVGLYKKQPTKITSDNVNTAGILLFEDCWFWVYCLGVLAYAYMWADDQRGGNTNVDKSGQYQLNGAFGHFDWAINEMRNSEPLPLTDNKTVPDPRKGEK